MPRRTMPETFGGKSIKSGSSIGGLLDVLFVRAIERVDQMTEKGFINFPFTNYVEEAEYKEMPLVHERPGLIYYYFNSEDELLRIKDRLCRYFVLERMFHLAWVTTGLAIEGSWLVLKYK